ncbi:MAG: hypothetical protein CR986_09690 [Ignavibacteriae bacterium]|nr:MAG: hypothetical protein CR986_09690 [Ignavibacteriota bacterium]
MKLNWGTGITITIIVFTLTSLIFIYFATTQDINLVRDDYYEAEVNFNKKMETVKLTKTLSEEIKIKTTQNYIEIQFPAKFPHNKIKGVINLYRPSDRKKDLSLNIQTDSTNLQLINTKKIIRGMWRINIDWSVDSTNYFSTKSIMIN